SVSGPATSRTVAEPAASTAKCTSTVPETPCMRASGGAIGRRPLTRSGTPGASVTSRTAEIPGVGGVGVAGIAGAGEAAAPAVPSAGDVPAAGGGPAGAGAGVPPAGFRMSSSGGAAGRGTAGVGDGVGGDVGGGAARAAGAGEVAAGTGDGVAEGGGVVAGGTGDVGGVASVIGAGGAAEPAGGVGDASATAGASMRRGPLNRRSTWRPPLPPEANSALTSKANPPGPSIGLNRHVRRAWMTDSAQGDSPLFIRASATCPSGSSVTSAVTVAVSGPAPAGNAGTTPWRRSGMPSSRDISGRRILNSMGTVRITLTGSPSTFVISYSHSRAAVSP